MAKDRMVRSESVAEESDGVASETGVPTSEAFASDRVFPGSTLNGPPIHTLVITSACRAELLSHLEAASPNEGVGLLAVDRAIDRSGRVVATRFFAGTNVDISPTRYTMDPMEVLRAVREMDARGWRLGAIVHSHLASPATPSQTDLREAHYPDAVMLIASFATRPPDLRAWRIDQEDDLRIVHGVRLEVVSPPPEDGID